MTTFPALSVASVATDTQTELARLYLLSLRRLGWAADAGLAVLATHRLPSFHDYFRAHVLLCTISGYGGRLSDQYVL